MRLSRILAVAGVVALFGTACAWGQPGGTSARNWANPFEVALTADNVDELALSWQAPGITGEPVMDDRYVYGIRGVSLFAYAAGGPRSAEGASRCSGSPVVCTPVWSSRLSEFVPAADVVVSGEQVFAVAFRDGAYRLVVLDAHPESCPTTGDGCPPLWTGEWQPGPGSNGVTLTVAEGRVFVSSLTAAFEVPQIAVFDEFGRTNCTSGPARTCTPLFRVEGDFRSGSFPKVAVAGGRLFVSRTGPPDLATVFDATGVAGCTNGVCTPLRRLDTTGQVAISGTTAYAVAGNTLQGFDATGVSGCSGSPVVCQPRFTGRLSGALADNGEPIAVSNGRVLVAEDNSPSGNPVLEVFDAAGVAGCSGAPAVCTPLWRVERAEAAGLPNRLSATPSLVIMTGPSMRLFDLAGTRGCGGAPKACTPLVRVATGETERFSAGAVAFGRIALKAGDTLRVYARPG
jgi:hypothetical protein